MVSVRHIPVLCLGLILLLQTEYAGGQTDPALPIASDSVEVDDSDTAGTIAADSVVVTATDSSASGTTGLDGFLPETIGFTVGDKPLAATRYAHLADLLETLPGAFLYDHGISGWPQGWSIDGLPPHLSSARLDNAPFNDLFTGSALLEDLPVELLSPPRLSLSDPGPSSLSTRIRRLYGRPPLTEIRFNQGSEGRQFISVLHSQDRSQRLFGRPGRLNALFRYGGRGSSGAFPGSNARSRQVFLRVGYSRPRWSAATTYLLTRSDRGAQSGVLPRPGGNFDSVYETFSPLVRQEGASLQRHRDDIGLHAAFRWSRRLPPLSASAYLTSQRTSYRFGGDTIRVVGVGTGATIRQPLISLAQQEVALEFRAGVTRHRDSPALRDTLGERRRYALVSLSDSSVVLGFVLRSSAYFRTEDIHQGVGFKAHVERRLGRFRLETGGQLSHYFPSLFDELGFGELLLGSAALNSSAISRLLGAAGVALGPIDLSVRLAGLTIRDPIDYWNQTPVLEDQPPLAVVRQTDGEQRMLTATFSIGWRSDRSRGFFATAAATYRRTDRENGTSSLTALPETEGNLNLGLRYLLFKGDLDLEVTARLHGWSDFEGRTLHSPTGLFALQDVDPLLVDSSGRLDLHVQAGVRTATIFLSAENLLAGYLYPGVMLVPVYPLPRMAIQFGVYWPLRN